MKIDSTAGAILAASRRASGITQAQMAGKLGLTQVTVSKWENGRKSLDLEDMNRWYQALSDDGRRVMRSLDVFSMGA